MVLANGCIDDFNDIEEDEEVFLDDEIDDNDDNDNSDIDSLD